MMNDEIADLLEEGWPPIDLPKVRRNKNNKTISVKNILGEKKITIKVIAPYEIWLEFEEKLMEGNLVKFKTVEKYLRGKNKNIELVRVYSKEYPDQFSLEFYGQYVWEANLENPKNELAKKPRGTYYGIDRRKMTEIKYSAIHLYVFLSYWIKNKKPDQPYPEEFKKLNEKYRIMPREIISVTMELIENHYKIGLLDAIDDPRTFYNNYIANKSLEKIKKMYKRIQYKPLMNPEHFRNSDSSTDYIPLVQPLMKVLKSAI